MIFVRGKEDKITLEVDELWSYVGTKDNPQWLWLLMLSRTRQVIAMQAGRRDKQTAEKLFYKLTEPLKKALYYTDDFSVYYETIAFQQHRPVGKESGKTCYVERLKLYVPIEVCKACKKNPVVL